MNRGRISFFVFFLCFYSCAAQKSGADFYEGLKKWQNGAQTGAIACFEKALGAANPAVAGAAAAELMNLHSAGAELSPAIMAVIQQKAAGSWAKAFDAMDQAELNREKSLALLLDGESRSLDAAALYALEKWRNDGAISFTGAENAVIDGRIAVSRSRYNEALIFFRIALHDSPDLFFRYPDLIADLGRTFQYTATGLEGMELFLGWENAGQWELVSAENENLVRFRLLFFAARIARQRGNSGNIELFEKALPFAREVSPEQTDACIWYILDSSLAQGSDRIIRYLETYIPQWHHDAYFSDVMDKLARDLVLKRQWEKVLHVFSLLRNRSGVTTAQYAWITGRAIEEGLFSTKESAREYMKTAYNQIAGNQIVRNAGGSAWYYRSLGAAALGEPFLTLPGTDVPLSKKKAASNAASNADVSDTMRFLLGFFENDAAQFAPQYIRAEESGLSSGELYRLAEALGAAGQYQESIRLVSLYAGRNDYQIKRQDLELLYPRPFREPVERYAEELGIKPSLLYGLIRTESAFNSDIVSRAGAVGLTQLMPATAREMAARIHRRGGPDYIVEDFPSHLHDPAVNIHIGASYLAYLNERMEDPLLALLAYNGGMGRVRRWYRTANLPPDLFLETVEYSETRNYGRSVIGAAAMYEALYGNP